MKYRLSDDAYLLQGQPMFKLLAQVKQIEKSDPNRKIYHFEIGDPDFDTPENVKQALYRSVKNGRTHYTESVGLPEYREAVRELISKSHGFAPDIRQIAAVPGANSIVYTIVKILVNPGDDVILPDPSFPTYASALSFARANPVYVPLREELGLRWDLDELEGLITPNTRLIILNSPGNPSGSVFLPSDIERIYQIAEKYDLFILSDEVYSDIIYDQTVFMSPSVYDKCSKRTIILDSLSKKYAMTGWRQGYAVGPADIIEKVALFIMTVNSCVPPFLQEAAIEALQNGQYALQQMTAEYKRRRNIMVRILNEIPGVSCASPNGALYCFPNIRETGLSSREFADFALDNNVALLPGSDFGNSGEGFVRLCFANSAENIEIGLNLLKSAVTRRIE